jgi:hypothetical protein
MFVCIRIATSSMTCAHGRRQRVRKLLDLDRVTRTRATVHEHVRPNHTSLIELCSSP